MLKLVDQMRMIAETKNIYSSVNALIVLLFVARILKILDFQPRMALITRTLSEAGTDLLHFCILFTIVLVGYATMGCVLFGGQIIKFQTLIDSMIVLIFVLLGWDQVVFREMVTAANTQQVFATKLAFYLFYWSWIVISTFVLLNVILAIVVDAYSSVKRKSTNSRTMPSEMMEVGPETQTPNKWTVPARMMGIRPQICHSEFFNIICEYAFESAASGTGRTQQTDVCQRSCAVLKPHLLLIIFLPKPIALHCS